MRTFLAIPLPADVRDGLADLAGEIGGLRAQEPDTIHLTVRFLGEIDNSDEIVAAVRPVVASHDPFSFGLRGLGGFPRKQRATVLWVGIEDHGLQAGSLAAGVDQALAGVGIERDRRPWHGHVTLGRFRAPKKLSRQLLARSADFGEIAVDRLNLYRSVLSPQGARHEVVSELSLGTGM